MGIVGFKRVKKLKIQLPISFVFAEEKYMQTLLDFLFYIDVDRVSRVVEKVENSDHKKSSDGGVENLMLVFWQFSFCFLGKWDLQLCFCFFMLQKKQGGNVLGICYGRKRLNAMITNKQTTPSIRMHTIYQYPPKSPDGCVE